MPLLTAIELELQSVHGTTIRGTPEQLAAPGFFAESMKKRLERSPSLQEDLIPSFPPGCRRLTPGPGYLEALTDDKVNTIREGIARINETGVVTNDGVHHPVDSIMCATGFDTSFLPRFPITGRGGRSLAEKWRKFPNTYLSMSTDDFPNYFISLGPNSALGSGNLLFVIEKAMDYFTDCVLKLQRDNISSMVPRKQAVDGFFNYCKDYFDTTVFTYKCRSWYKSGLFDGPISALWPGKLSLNTKSCGSANKVLL